MFLQSRNSHTGPLFKDANVLKSFDKSALENCIFISKSLKSLLPSVFNIWFKFSSQSHPSGTRWANIEYLKTPSYQTKTYGGYPMIVNAVN